MHDIRLKHHAFMTFLRALERPPRPKKRLAALLKEKSILEDPMPKKKPKAKPKGKPKPKGW